MKQREIDIGGEIYTETTLETGHVITGLKMNAAQLAIISADRKASEEKDVSKKQVIAAAIPSVADVEKKIDAAVVSKSPVESLAAIIKDLVRAVAALGDRP